MKKEIAIILCMVMLFSLTACAGRDTSSNNESTNISQTQNNNQPEENTSSDVGNGGKKNDNGYSVIGEAVTFNDDGYLDDFDTISIEIPADFPQEEYDSLMGIYIGDSYTYYYLPDPDALADGRVEFETLHHSKFAAAKADKDVLINEWSKRAAVNIVTQGVADGNVKETFGDLINGVLEEYGLDSGTYGGNVLEYVLSADTKGEILQAALDGDQTKLKQKSASLIADALFEKAKIEGAGDLVDVVCAFSNAENWAEGAAEMSKEIQKKIFPEIDAVSKFADLVDKTFDVWAANTMDEVYRYQYAKRNMNSDGSISDDDWNEIYSTIHGAWARYQSKGISEDALRKSFEARAKNEKLISEKETELKKLAKQWDKDGLLNSHYYSENWTAADRLKSLYQSREMLIKMFTKDGKLQKGAYSDKTDSEFIDLIHFKWTICGTKNRNNFYKWLEEEEIVSKTVANERYAWYLVKSEVTRKPENVSEGDKIETYDVSETSRAIYLQNKNMDGKIEKATFTVNCENPPSVIYADKEYSMHLSINADGETELYFRNNTWITDGYGKLETKDGKGTFVVGTHEGDDKSFDVTLYGIRGAGGEGSMFELKLVGSGCDTTWTYEWKKMGSN